ncbi:aldose 1-epimerase [Pseudocolwellia sp. AS88]|uniref:aldose 1-epimerase n=1 Tax=Pseudocolwellia sp. AS88 TaxID=3063958 RepID=UPI0026EB1BEA|nr:aldose 1-epimerase [Pseudocolwellia sp. AS88]MDO7084796.1 aldose 1-epimerase [Pseudocolwellia sp. AS88]
MNSIVLENSTARVEVSPSLGGSILAYDVNLNGQFIPILREASNAKSVHESANFPLVPYSNRIRHGQFSWQEKEMTLPLNHLPEKHSIHGHGWLLPWEIKHKTDTSLTLQYHYKTSDWPFSYRAEQVFTLKDNSLTIELSVINYSNNEMPAGLGLHPYFSLTDNTSITCSVEKMWTVDDESMPIELVNVPTGMTDSKGLLVTGSNLDNVFTGFDGAATITWPERKIMAKITTSSNCKFAVIYSPKGKDFFCFEPVTHCTDAINLAQKGVKNTGVISLNPQEKVTVSMCISPEELTA